MKITIDATVDLGASGENVELEITNEDMNTPNLVDIVVEAEPGKFVCFSVSVRELFLAASAFEEIRRTFEPR